MVDEQGRYVQSMFARIADRYDLMNWLMTSGQDSQWRKEVIRRAHIPESGKILDLGAGTGDLAGEVLEQHPNCLLLATDFTMEMMRFGKSSRERRNSDAKRINWNAADAQYLPYANDLFDAVVSGFLLRNVSDLRSCLKETYRVMKPGGRMVALDTTPPKQSPFLPFVNLYLNKAIPFLGKILTNNCDAYLYLPGSTKFFLEPEKLSARLYSTGFRNIGYRSLMFGTIAIHWCSKPV